MRNEDEDFVCNRVQLKSSVHVVQYKLTFVLPFQTRFVRNIAVALTRACSLLIVLRLVPAFASMSTQSHLHIPLHVIDASPTHKRNRLVQRSIAHRVERATGSYEPCTDQSEPRVVMHETMIIVSNSTRRNVTISITAIQAWQCDAF